MELPVLSNLDSETAPGIRPTVALVGNPNAGKTTLFNALTGLRGSTANFPGTTVEHRRGTMALPSREVLLIDLPGLYDLETDATDERIARRALLEGMADGTLPDLVVLVVDATNLQRNLFLAGQILELERPAIIALNMTDLAEKHDIEVNAARLSLELNCAVVPISARSGRNLDELRRQIESALPGVADREETPSRGSCQVDCGGCTYAARHRWAEQVSGAAIERSGTGAALARSMAIDRWVTHPVTGLICFAGVMLATFLLIFWLAQLPMELIDGLFAVTARTLGAWLPAGDFNSLVSEGLIGGVGGLLVFLPQICILFFVLALLEDSGYLARAAFVMDRLMRHVGLPGKAFVPLLSAHACAIPAIMASRVVDDRRDRLITILVAPLMSCSARVPVYAMVTALLFPAQPLAASLTFAGAYFLGIGMALAMAWLFRRTILPGESQPLMIELPNYRVPSLRNAGAYTLDRARAFLQNAGTVILVFSLILWFLATYPKLTEERLTDVQRESLIQVQAQQDQELVDRWWNQASLQYSMAGRLGRVVQPVFAPLGLDWKMSIGVVTSFAAREVIVSTLAILYGMGEETGQQELIQHLKSRTHEDQTPVFTNATCLSLLVFYVLAMQCLPTQAVTRRETGGWKWPIFQFSYMTILAYTCALVTYQVAQLFEA